MGDVTRKGAAGKMMALQGIRVLDITAVWAGPHCTRLMADMGAEVIKIEAVRRPDTVRGPKKAQPGGGGYYANRDPGERPYNRMAYFNERNRNKQGITLDMTKPQGIELFKRLLAVSDVVVENFAAGVVKRWGMGYEEMKAVKNDIIYCSMPGYGNAGPERDYVGYGVTIEQVSGIGAVTGYLDGLPTRTGIDYTDPIASMTAAGAVLAALYYRSETGKGQYIDLSQQETTVSLIGEAMMDWTMNQRVQKPMANRDSSMAPNGVYPCAGSDMWVAISVGTDEEWQRFRTVMGDPEWAHDARFDDVLGRWHNQDELDAYIAGWTRERDHYNVANLLQKAGIAAGPVLANYELLDDPQFVGRGWFVVTEHREAGIHPYPGIAWRMADTPGGVYMAAPLFAEHNREILVDLLGLTEEEMAGLAEAGVIGDEPAGGQSW